MNTRSVVLWVIRVAAAVSLLVGLVIWTGQADSLILIHVLVGAVLSIALLVLGVQALRARVSTGLGVTAIVWALALPVLGLTQGAFPDSAALFVQLFHLILGIGAWVLAEMIGRQLPTSRA